MSFTRRLAHGVRHVPLLGDIAVSAAGRLQSATFRGSGPYWERRYSRGGTSGPGSYGEAAQFKATFINDFVSQHSVESVIEWGCGDGNQLALSSYPKYIGLDVSRIAVQHCIQRFAGQTNKSFFAYASDAFEDRLRLFSADLALSLDVLYHLPEDEVFHMYMERLFASANHFVIIYATNFNSSVRAGYIRHRQFTRWVDEYAPGWHFLGCRAKPASSEEVPAFYTYARRPPQPV